MWKYTLGIADIFYDEEIPFEVKRDEITRRIRNSRFFSGDDLVLLDIVERLEESLDEDEFDSSWGLFYDYADYHRIWVETIK